MGLAWDIKVPSPERIEANTPLKVGQLPGFLRAISPVMQQISSTEGIVYDLTLAQVGAAAHARNLELHELAPAGTSLEALFLQLTGGHS